MSQQIQDYLVNIKSFQTYLDHIVNSIESERYHEDTIKNLSDLISVYYRNINEDDPDKSNDEIEFIETDSDTSVQGNKETSDNSDSDSDSSEDDYSNLFISTNKKIEPVNVTDKYLDEFTNKNVDNSELHFYNKHPEFVIRFDNFINNVDYY